MVNITNKKSPCYCDLYSVFPVSPLCVNLVDKYLLKYTVENSRKR